MTPDPRRGTFGTIFVILLIAAILCAAVVSFSVMDLNGSEQVGVGISGTPTTLTGPPTPTVTVTVTGTPRPPAPIVVPSNGASCNLADKGLHAYLPNANGLPDLTSSLMCDGTHWITSTESTAPAPTFTYAVEPGDTLSGLSDKFNVPQEKIYDQNKALIPTDKHLKPGTVLRITPEG